MNQERVVKAGLLGLGTVGSGVYKLVECQKDEMGNERPGQVLRSRRYWYIT